MNYPFLYLKESKDILDPLHSDLMRRDLFELAKKEIKNYTENKLLHDIDKYADNLSESSFESKSFYDVELNVILEIKMVVNGKVKDENI